MGFLWQGSTGARAVEILRGLPIGTGIATPEFAEMLGVRAQALHQLLANAVGLRLIKKVRGGHCIIWKIGAGNDSANIEVRRAPKAVLRVPLDVNNVEQQARRLECRMRRAAKLAAAEAATGQPSKSSRLGPRLAADQESASSAPHAALDGGKSCWNFGPLNCALGVKPVAELRDGGDTAACVAALETSRYQGYAAQWQVWYVDDGGQIRGVIRIQHIDPALRQVTAWCDVRQAVHTFALDKFRRVADASTAERIDVEQWLSSHHRSRWASEGLPHDRSRSAAAKHRG